jgi:phosphonate transport system substrate-binding protein
MQSVSQSPTFTYDGNFRFDENDPAWQELFERYDMQPVRYDDMAKLTGALSATVQTASYLPAANYFYVRDQPYEPVASAVYAAENSTSLTSVLVVRSSSDVTELAQLRGGSLGYVHPYCTTSYFAPALLLSENGYSLSDFFGQLVGVAAYEPQIDAVIEGQVDATMVQEDVWRKHPHYAEVTRVIARREELPTPVLIVDRNAAADLKRDLSELALSHRPAVTVDTLFAGFAPYRREQVHEFLAESESAVPALPTAV